MTTATGSPSTDPGPEGPSWSEPGAAPGALHRSDDRRMIAGVAGGIAETLDLDVTLVRVGFVALAFLGGLAVPLYAAAWLLVPDAASGRSVADDVLDRSGLR